MRRFPAPSDSAAPRRAIDARRLLPPLAVCLALYGIDLACMAAVPEAGRAFAAGVAVPFDLMVFVPLAFYLLVVRRNGLSPLIVLPVIGLGGLVSAQLAPVGQFSLHVPLAALAVAVDLSIGIHEGRRLARSFRAARLASDEPLEWFERPFFELVRHEGAHACATELSVWYYALLSWRRPPIVPAGYRAFSYHRKSGYLALVGVIAALLPFEAVAVHLLVAQWSEAAAIALTALTAYTLVWIVGDARAVALNPLLVGDGALQVKWGSHFRLGVPLDLVESVEAGEPALPKRERVNMAAMGAAPCWIVLSEPVQARGLLGMPRPVRAVCVSPDDAAAFRRAVLREG
ncbi:hypothetical protein C1878_04415 [Gordonibacter sp. 28C]|uniref:hypothetical protein n=1 Tax=Gordonibacter sp. 28C TaxID=2078569 RepID=UPI000DF79D2D|nr:hypothetical protein [Gordonibacter sp. 28C]RDB63118.1 hypothetical protein C1878_04415 [Gordonibacter sp. 28C]